MAQGEASVQGKLTDWLSRVTPESVKKIAAKVPDIVSKISETYQHATEVVDSARTTYGHLKKAVKNLQDGNYPAAKEEFAKVRSHGQETIKKAASLFRSSHEAVTQIAEVSEEVVSGAPGPITDAAKEAEKRAQALEQDLKRTTTSLDSRQQRIVVSAAQGIVEAGVKSVNDATATPVVADARPLQTAAAQIS